MGNAERVRNLVRRGGDIDTRELDGCSALHFAALGGYREVMEILLRGGADVRARDNREDTPLHGATVRGHKEVAELSVARGAEVNAQNSRGRTPPDEALRRGHKEIVRLLTAKTKGSKVGVQDDGSKERRPGRRLYPIGGRPLLSHSYCGGSAYRQARTLPGDSSFDEIKEVVKQ